MSSAMTIVGCVSFTVYELSPTSKTREVTLDADVVGKLGPGELELGESPQDVLERSRAPQVLLLQPEELALVHVVIGV